MLCICMCWYVVYVHASGHVCVFLVFSCEYGSFAISIREISCWQAEPRSVPGPLTTLCLWDPWNVQECGFGQVERSSSETDTQTQPPPPPPSSSPLSLHQLVFPPPHYTLSLKFPLTLRLKNECQETALRFFSLHMVSGEEMEADKLERKGWFNTRARVQAFPFIFFLLAIFFLCLIDGVWTPLSAHTHRDIPILLQMDCRGVSGLSFPAVAHSICLSKKFDVQRFSLRVKLEK